MVNMLCRDGYRELDQSVHGGLDVLPMLPSQNASSFGDSGSSLPTCPFSVCRHSATRKKNSELQKDYRIH